MLEKWAKSVQSKALCFGNIWTFLRLFLLLFGASVVRFDAILVLLGHILVPLEYYLISF